ncbi:OB-fold domain-containing protein [Phyllobacterium sp. YR531]|uniref:Zn-ribbon domain-containing OB-fold protein n=1 Tax=Phyllobacterium sp. YR531 TaxID=1144343 RepID=UPI00026FB1D8|nr:OB-fold domain-containing protein [Phyllobacterium sp. YR531]EJN06741.1 putative nucleic-acid-binding protein containing a Zn-ribbon [Phyllobacterium sp. YR531]
MSFPTVNITDVNRPYWDGLAEGKLRYQCCEACGNTWLPSRANCPKCLAADPKWREASGRGRVISWVVYHTAYTDHLKARVPYDVTLVELDEGPRLLTNVIDSEAGKKLTPDAPVALSIESEEGVSIPRFRLQQNHGAL